MDPAPAALTLGEQRFPAGEMLLSFQGALACLQSPGGTGHTPVTGHHSPRGDTLAEGPRESWVHARSPGPDREAGELAAGKTPPCSRPRQPLRAAPSPTGARPPPWPAPLPHPPPRTMEPDRASGRDTGPAVSFRAQGAASCRSGPCLATEGGRAVLAGGGVVSLPICQAKSEPHGSPAAPQMAAFVPAHGFTSANGKARDLGASPP